MGLVADDPVAVIAGGNHVEAGENFFDEGADLGVVIGVEVIAVFAGEVVEDAGIADAAVEVAEAFLYPGGFGIDGSPAAPDAVGHDVDEVFLEDADGAKLAFERVHEPVELFLAFIEMGRFDDHIACEEAVFDGVLRDDFFALGGFGPGGFLGVFTIGSDLFFCSTHGYSSLVSVSTNRGGVPIITDLVEKLSWRTEFCNIWHFAIVCIVRNPERSWG